MSVDVIVRLRPKISSELENGQLSEEWLFTSPPNKLVTRLAKGSEKNWTFDAVLPEATTQEQVFEYTAGDSLISLCRGKNSTILAYGQTSAGKTHTMFGTDQDPGVIPRLCAKLFTAVEQHKLQDRFKFSCSFVEIYLEKMADLLVDDPKPLKIHCSANVSVSGLTIVPIQSLAEVLSLISQGNSRKSMAATKLNSNSSRSHTVFTLYTERLDGAVVLCSKLHLVDLAGSERLKEIGNTHLAETKFINSSLSALSTVVQGLQQGNSHVHYRDSLLTTFLQDSIGPSGRTTFIINMSPHLKQQSSSLISLGFAETCFGVKKSLKAPPTVPSDDVINEIFNEFRKKIFKQPRIFVAGDLIKVERKYREEGLIYHGEINGKRTMFVLHEVDDVQRADEIAEFLLGRTRAKQEEGPSSSPVPDSSTESKTPLSLSSLGISSDTSEVSTEPQTPQAPALPPTEQTELKITEPSRTPTDQKSAEQTPTAPRSAEQTPTEERREVQPSSSSNVSKPFATPSPRTPSAEPVSPFMGLMRKLFTDEGTKRTSSSALFLRSIMSQQHLMPGTTGYVQACLDNEFASVAKS